MNLGISLNFLFHGPEQAAGGVGGIEVGRIQLDTLALEVTVCGPQTVNGAAAELTCRK